jgi:CubicO group peptidase (beta-lactamase class C family)
MFAAKRLVLSLILVACLLHLVAPIPAAAGSSALLTPQSAQAFFDQRIPAYLEQYHIAGATVAAVQDGEVIFTRGYGTADAASSSPVEPGATLFRIGSLTKLFTWTAVMQLVEAGRLDLHADVNRYLDFTLPATYPQPITMWHLMTHTGGFENRNLGYGAASAADLQPLSQWLPAHIPARVRPPGAAAAYSNYGAALAGYIVERVSGQPYAQYIRQHILQPLGLQHTTVEMIPPADLAPAISRGYTYVVNNGEGRYVAAEPPLLEVAPAGSIAATADDMAQFMLAQLGAASNGARLLGPATLAAMHATAYQADLSLNGMALGFFELSRHGEQIVGHVGAAMPSFHSLLALLPTRKAGFFVSFNSASALPLTTGASAILLRDFVDRFIPEPPAQPLQAPGDFDARAAAYAGAYRFANNPSSSATTLEKSAELLGGAVTLAAPGDGTLHLRDAWGEKRFVEVAPAHFREVNAGGLPGDDALVFALDAQGQVGSFALASRSSQAFERLAWYQAPIFAQLLLAVCLLLFLSTVVAALASWWWRRGKASGGQPRRTVLARRVALAAAVLNLLFVAGYAAVLLLAPESIALGELALLGGVLALPVFAALLAIGSLPFAWLAWRDHYWGLPARVHYTATVVGLLAFAWFLNQWNLLGWRF